MTTSVLTDRTVRTELDGGGRRVTSSALTDRTVIAELDGGGRWVTTSALTDRTVIVELDGGGRWVTTSVLSSNRPDAPGPPLRVSEQSAVGHGPGAAVPLTVPNHGAGEGRRSRQRPLSTL